MVDGWIGIYEHLCLCLYLYLCACVLNIYRMEEVGDGWIGIWALLRNILHSHMCVCVCILCLHLYFEYIEWKRWVDGWIGIWALLRNGREAAAAWWAPGWGTRTQ